MMNDPFGEVPVLPVVIPMGIVLFALLSWRLRARGLLTLPRVAEAAALAVYAAGIVANTVFPVFTNPPAHIGPWSPAVSLTPFSDYEVEDAVTNMIVFVPLGILIPLMLKRPSWWRVLAAAVGTSLAIELTQLAMQDLAGGGHVADINDLIFNTLGGIIGYGLFLLGSRLPGCSRLVERFRWSPQAETSVV